MEYFEVLIGKIAALPDWCIFLPPALLLVLFVPLVLKRRRRVYTVCAVVLGSAGCLLLAAQAEIMLAYAVCFVILWAALFPFFFLPKREKKSRSERIYERFKPEIELPERREREIPKVCCYEEDPPPSALDDAPRLDHVMRLVDKLRREKLSPADRLEVDMLSRTLGAESVGTEVRSDALAAILRLTAKYKL